jgi:hypothetical protein
MQYRAEGGGGGAKAVSRRGRRSYKIWLCLDKGEWELRPRSDAAVD